MIKISMGLLLLSTFICFFRVVFAENTATRIVAADSLGVILVIVLGLTAILIKAVYVLDIAVAYSVLLFIDVLVFAKYFEKRV